ncbi:RagB/SusD family nutrient uptake outer membrane protein [Chryseobacterium koreense]|uniref:RagB/SusD family nutrient uptake outer membrane protein n=1 Tax=Chryseobacterium koreense TaxID=232216 RepID=UPI0026F03DD4|nr:RagB/SusD family nutrient uptake outer membrane protein [Chryseobacterium koreense]
MTKKIIFSAVLGLLVTLTSCREEFLQSEPTETLSNPPAQAKLYGLYQMMVNTETGGTTGHDDYGQKGYDLLSDLLSSDMVLSGVTYGWYRNVANLTAPVDYTQNTNYQPWRYYYRIGYAANDVISGLGGNDAVPANNTDKFAMGQAKAMRAYSYFYLLQFFTPKYDPEAKSIPLYTDTSVIAKPRAKQSEVYAQIVKDLTEAIQLLDGFSRANKGIINRAVAQGLLAYTYAAMGGNENNEKAAALAQQIMAAYPVTSRSEAVFSVDSGSGGGFNDLKTSSWMWGYDISEANGLDLISWWGQADIFTYSYAWAGDAKSIDLGLYSAIRTDDVRKQQFVTIDEVDPTPANPLGYVYRPATQDGDYPAVPANKFYAPGRVIGGQRIITSDYVFMRSDEFYLLAAETLAKSGSEAQAKTILKNYLSNRLNDTSYIDALSGVALQKEIYLQTRIELWGEGKSYLAMKRNQATVTRGPNHLFFMGQSFNFDDPRLTLSIPQAEVNNNPNL